MTFDDLGEDALEARRVQRVGLDFEDIAGRTSAQ